MKNSSYLPIELWKIIGSKLSCACSQLRFCAVCKSWSTLLPSCKPPLLMLAECEASGQNEVSSESTPPPPRWSFVCLGEQEIHKIDFPEIHQARIVGSIDNWVITVHKDATIRLSNPFSRLQIHLPSELTFEDGNFYQYRFPHYWNNLETKIVMSSSPTKGEDWVAMAVHSGLLAFARPGDTGWTIIKNNFMAFQNSYNWTASVVKCVIFYKEQFYAIDHTMKLLVCDTGGGAGSPNVMYITDSFNQPFPTHEHKRYLVEWSGELLLVIKQMHNVSFDVLKPGETYKTKRFDIYRFDFSNSKWDRLKSLGEHSLFLGFNTSVAVLASDYYGSVKKNCIYFTDDYPRVYRGYCTGLDMGVFSLEDHSITPHYKGILTSLYSPPVWLIST